MKLYASAVTVRRIVVASVVVLLVAGAFGPVAGTMTTPDEEEPNDSLEDAQSIETGEEIRGEITEDDEDWFAFTVEAGETINVSAFGSSGGRTAFVIQSPGGGFIVSGKASGGRTTVGTTATESGTYYVKVRPNNAGSFGAEYSFTVDTYRTDDYEPNEDRGNATQITTGEEISGEISAGDVDWFTVAVERGETINVSAFGSSGGRTAFVIQSADGEFIVSGKASGGRTTVGTTATESGTYYVKVRPNNAGSFGAEYNFIVETYRTDPFEPNEDRGNATRLYENPLPSDTAELSRGDADWFAFGAAQDEPINVSVFAGTRDNTKFWLKDPSGGFVVSDTTGGGSVTIGTTAATGGTHYLQVTGDGDGFGAEYNFTVDVPGETLGLPNDRFERGNPPVGNDDRANASAVDPGTYTDLGMVDDDRDVFAVDLEAGERLLAGVEFANDENDLALELLDDSGSVVESVDTSSDGERLAYAADADGAYYLRVTGEAGRATTYDLNLTVVHPVTVTVGPGGGAIAPGNTTTVDVVVSGVEGGLTGGTLTFGSTNATVVAAQSVEAAGGSANVDVSESGGTASATVTDLDPGVCGNVTVARVTVASVESGSATLGVDADATLSGDEGHAYRVELVENTTLSVEPGAGASVEGSAGSDSEACPDARPSSTATTTPADATTPTESGEASGDGGDGSSSDGQSGESGDSGDGGTDRTQDTSNGLGTGFGPLVALLALAVAALLARRRR